MNNKKYDQGFDVYKKNRKPRENKLKILKMTFNFKNQHNFKNLYNSLKSVPLFDLLFLLQNQHNFFSNRLNLFYKIFLPYTLIISLKLLFQVDTKYVYYVMVSGHSLAFLLWYTVILFLSNIFSYQFLSNYVQVI